ncbi:uncharacterized protein YukE [Kitasatospora sp. MAP12-15]|uniref:WXG100 family type VII secretion target n=1 Tax=unclassified Kitasatospora TaxID=2633591 RepID=UPI002476DB9C|nr:WXG100 family type VII secretion target [Kitasatospora sp. MAP12-44]MDH6110722.1 uncharacterized protein YukE [Kitasatospora sp. MAP12-44]
MSSDITDFNSYSHSALRTMAQALNPGDVMSASDPWRRAAATLKQIRTALDTASGDATDAWEGTTSNAFYEKMTKLANSVNNTAAYANDAASTLAMMSDAIAQAKREMPEEPGFLAQVANAISDTAQSAVGIDDDSTEIPLADRRKAEAVAVMQTLANKYRASTQVLKPPPMTSPEEVDAVPPPDTTSSAAVGALVMGAGLGAIGGYSFPAQGGYGPESRALGSDAQHSPAVVTRSDAITDPGISGGIAQAAPRPPRPVGVGVRPAPGTTLDGAIAPAAAPRPTWAATSVGAGAAATGTGDGVRFPAAVGLGLIPGEAAGVPARGVGSADFLGEPQGKGAGAVDEPRGRQKAFTEGGTGLGARGRAQDARSEGDPQRVGYLPGSTKDERKKNRRAGKRADYLVEDEQTWNPDQRVNPTVVE